MTRLFLDANVLFTAAHNPQGKAVLIISLGQHRLVELATSAYAGEEARRNLARKFPKALEPFETMLAHLTIVADDITIACPASLAEKDRPIRATSILFVRATPSASGSGPLDGGGDRIVAGHSRARAPAVTAASRTSNALRRSASS